MKSGEPLEVEENNDFSIGSMVRENSGNEARFEAKEELEGGEVEVRRGGVDHACRGSVQKNGQMSIYSMFNRSRDWQLNRQHP